MCLTVPMRVEEIDGHRARCAALGAERWGDYVTIHLGFVQGIVPEKEALESQALWGEIAAVLDGAEGGA